MEASIVDLRRRMKDILKALDRNETITITYHGSPRAKLVPIDEAHKNRSRAKDDPSFGMWADREDMKDVKAYVRRLRRNRYSDL